jgi:hypothetical protein
MPAAGVSLRLRARGVVENRDTPWPTILVTGWAEQSVIIELDLTRHFLIRALIAMHTG